MPLDPQRFQQLINDFAFTKLFIDELGWDRAASHSSPLKIDEESFTLTPIAQKRGVMIYRCSPDATGRIPPRVTLLKIEKEAARLTHEHLLIFADSEHTTQTWLWVARTPGTPDVTRTHTWHKGTSGEALRQKLAHIVWSLEQEEGITLTDVVIGLKRAFDRDRVTRTFYERFSSEHKVFGEFIEGIKDLAPRQWYASLMLNRLMFVYFIQRKGFLDGDTNYLAHRMRRVQAEVGKGRFHSFYRRFLLCLFHEGLGQHKESRAKELDALLGKVPYLNGGLFELHDLEEAYPDIDIPDEAFARLFEFFDDFDWHLDDRPLASGKEINPDVLGYIFEKYINQKQMGAYYTKEDITGYIAKNTVIPFLLERARERCKVAFEGGASVWKLLQRDPDRYLYPAMKRGVIDANGREVPESTTPDFVQSGMKDANARMLDRRYNLGEAVFATTTGERGTLPTETWREYVERRTRCLAVREKMQRGEVREVDNLITLNLDIRQFMQDVIDTCAGPELLRAIWQAIVGRIPEKSHEKFRRGISILDPTCGSGAFLFAALNVLEPLYESCLDRMAGFIEDQRLLPKTTALPSTGEGRGVGESHRYPDFQKTLSEVSQHPSRRYYIYKTIVVHNLFGVDIIAEAVEICKLRLFLKLVSQVDKIEQLSPLPDIDFNIRCGNTLVGYATLEQLRRSADLSSDPQHLKEIEARCADLSDAFNRFREQQTVHGGSVTATHKRGLRDRLTALTGELDRFLAREYGIDPDKKKAFNSWGESHQPFHWFAEFHGAMAGGGFDVVIGNPPYVEYSKVRDVYRLTDDFDAFSTNLYAACTYRVTELVHVRSSFSLIVPISLPSTDRMKPLREILARGSFLYHVSFNTRPGKLFEGAEQRLTIFVRLPGAETRILSGGYLNWTNAERPNLFETLLFVAVKDVAIRNGIWAKVRGSTELSILQKMASNSSLSSMLLRKNRDSDSVVYYKNTGLRYFNSATLRPPRCWINGVASCSSRETTFSVPNYLQGAVHSILLSTTFFFFWQLASNCRDLNPSDISYFPTPDLDAKSGTLSDLSRIAEEDYVAKGRVIKMNNKRTGLIELESLTPANSKDILDLIDGALGEVYRFDNEQKDYLLSYCLKYRVGCGAEADADPPVSA